MSGRSLTLSGGSLCSKWGFGDGSQIDDWWWDTYDTDADVNTDDLLHALVVRHLVPAIEAAGHQVTITRIETSHNPVRAHTLDGQEVDWYAIDHELDTLCIDIPQPDVEAAAAALRTPTPSKIQP